LDTLRIVSDPLEAEGEFDTDPSHAAIIGLPQADSDEGALNGEPIAECFFEMHSAIKCADN